MPKKSILCVYVQCFNAPILLSFTDTTGLESFVLCLSEIGCLYLRCLALKIFPLSRWGLLL